MARPLQRKVVDHTLLDHYPQHWGAAMVTATVTSALRSCEYGARDTWSDLLTELLEGDPHAHAVLKKAYSTLSNADYELVPPDMDSKTEQKNAQVVADFVSRAIDAIPRWRGALYRLAWGHFGGLSAAETMWSFDGSEWRVRSVDAVPSRRLHYDDYFRPFVGDGSGSTTGQLLEAFPGKFLVFQPVVTGDLPTREGLARILVYWLAFKRWAVRDFVSYTERFGKPTPIITYKTGRDHADEDDVSLAEDFVEGMGRGTMPGAWIPDTLEHDFADAAKGSSGSGSGADRTVHNALITLCNNEVSKAVLGNTLTTEVGSTGGNRALGEVQSGDQLEILSAIARQIDEVVTRDLVRWIVRLNFGDDAAERYCPRYYTKLDAPEDLKTDAEVLKILVADLGLEVSKTQTYERFCVQAPTSKDDVLAVVKAAAPAPEQQPAQPDDDGGEDDKPTGPAKDPDNEGDPEEPGDDDEA